MLQRNGRPAKHLLKCMNKFSMYTNLLIKETFMLHLLSHGHILILFASGIGRYVGMVRFSIQCNEQLAICKTNFRCRSIPRAPLKDRSCALFAVIAKQI